LGRKLNLVNFGGKKMKEKSNTVCFRNILAYCLLFATFVASSTVAWALPENKSTAGELIVSGRNTKGETPFVMLNGERAFSGRTFFSSGTIATTEDNNATVKLGKLGSLSLSPNSILSLSFGSNKISGNLIAGQIKVFSNEGVEVKIQTADQVIINDASQNNVFTVDIQTGVTKAIAETGSVNLNNGDTTIPAQSGQQTATDENSYIGPLIVFGAVVAVAAIYVITHNNNNNNNIGVVNTVSPTR
jgi:hypothetical protein